jgi:hypothetical protein
MYPRTRGVPSSKSCFIYSPARAPKGPHRDQAVLLPDRGFRRREVIATTRNEKASWPTTMAATSGAGVLSGSTLISATGTTTPPIVASTELAELAISAKCLGGAVTSIAKPSNSMRSRAAEVGESSFETCFCPVSPAGTISPLMVGAPYSAGTSLCST